MSNEIGCVYNFFKTLLLMSWGSLEYIIDSIVAQFLGNVNTVMKKTLKITKKSGRL